jgi:hypothetical protein
MNTCVGVSMHSAGAAAAATTAAAAAAAAASVQEQKADSLLRGTEAVEAAALETAERCEVSEPRKVVMLLRLDGRDGSGIIERRWSKY